MPYYQDVVIDYLRADRSVFINTECCIQMNPQQSPDTSGLHWYCDAVAIDLRDEPTPTVFLCEISYAEKLGALITRLRQWAANWSGVREALIRDCRVRGNWPVRPWLFVREESVPLLVRKLNALRNADGIPIFRPRITTLEAVQPWKFHLWQHRDCETEGPPTIPEEMRV